MVLVQRSFRITCGGSFLNTLLNPYGCGLTAQAPLFIPSSPHLSLRPPWAILVTLSGPDFSTSW